VAELRSLVLVLGDQLDLESSACDGFAPQVDAVWMAEVVDEATHVWSSRPCTVMFLAAAQARIAALRPAACALGRVRCGAGLVSGGGNALRLVLPMVAPRHERPAIRGRPAGRQRSACMVTAPESDPLAPSLTVLYDGACPLCRREIGVYRGLPSSTPVCFADVSDIAQPLPPGTTREQLLARFHVRNTDGQLLSGAQAFLTLWAALPGWRWLARAGRLPGAAWTMESVYRLFLRVRPMLQRVASRLDRRV